MGCDILHLTYSSMGRDVDICEPILSYLELKYGVSVKRACMRDYAECLYQLRPKLLLTETKGSDTDVNAVRFAKALGIKVVNVTGEGDYVPGKADIFFWGWNKPEFAQPDMELLWSDRSRRIIFDELPETNNDKYNIKVSGGTGFDRYKFLPFMQKDKFLEKYHLTDYKKVVGFASWGFDVYDYRGDFAFHKEAGLKLNSVLKELIENNSDILFVLKFHPASQDEMRTEFAGLRGYSNVMMLAFEENVSDLINIADLWMGYETTTCLEAWLLGKTTLLINPSGGEFERSIIADGSPIFKTASEVQNAIDEYYKCGFIKAFEELNTNRSDIIINVIENDDGMNHVRAGEMVFDLLENTRENGQRDGFNWRYKLCIRTVQKLIYNMVGQNHIIGKKYFPLYSFFHDRYNDEEREMQHKKYYENLVRFYKQNGVVLNK